MKRVVSVSLGSSTRDHRFETQILGEPIVIERIGTDGDVRRAKELMRELDGKVDVLGIGGINLYLRAGDRLYQIRDAARIIEDVKKTPYVDGGGFKASWERWLITDYLPNRKGISFFGRKVLLVSSVDRYGMAEAFAQAGADVIYGDFIFGLGLPIPIRKLRTVKILAALLLPVLTKVPIKFLYPTGKKQDEITPKHLRYYAWAEVVAGDFLLIRRFLSNDMRGKIVLTQTITTKDIEELRKRGVWMLITDGPDMGGRSFATNVLQAVIVAVTGKRPEQISTDEYLKTALRAGFEPRIEELNPDTRPEWGTRGWAGDRKNVTTGNAGTRERGNASDEGIEAFAFLIHPLKVDDFARKYGFTRHLPSSLVEQVFKWIPPRLVSHITGIRSATGARAEGWFIGLPLTPRTLMESPLPFVYRRLIQAGRLAEKQGARIFGLGAFTKIVGDRGMTLAKNLNIAVTTGNSYTAATAVEGTLLAANRMDIVPRNATAAIIGATGSIGTVCSEMLAGSVGRLILVARTRESLEALTNRLKAVSRGQVEAQTDVREAIRQADIVLTVSSATDVLIEPEDLRPGSVVCDVARPRNVSRQVYARRNDVLVMDGGVIEVPGNPDFGLDFGLPPRMVEACMAETIILALEGRYENFTLGKDISLAKVEEISGLARKHGFKLSGFRRFERAISDEEVARIKRAAIRSVSPVYPVSPVFPVQNTE